MQFASLSLFCLFLLDLVAGVVHNGNSINSIAGHDSIRKVSFTQKGYIQFLKYVAHVPPITEYTFCIWVRSHNLTYSHPLLSYSKHEEDRLIRVWISPHGTGINLEILERHVFQIPVHFLENHWYHICQSWSSYQASWSLFLNGKLHASGKEPQLRGLKIKGGGDIVVGQEYTDFDKGLDDGIEGDAFGFNFVLSSTSYHSHSSLPLRRHYQESALSPPRRSFPANDVPRVLSYFTVETNRRPKQIYDIFDVFDVFGSDPNVRMRTVAKVRIKPRIVNELETFTVKSLGLKLVELSYICYLGGGAPVSGDQVLISWTKTPVRVFGGAILKRVSPFCT